MTGQDIRRTLQREFARTLRKPFAQAVKQYRLVRPGDKIAVCISGGKDSMLLALLMQDLQHTVDFSLVFLAMDPGYTPEGRARLEANAVHLGLPLEIFDTNVLRVAGNHAAEHPCFLCAKMRRGHLYTEAQKRGCNKIALGHHYDDAVSTVLMGLLYGGQVQAMLPRLAAKNYPGMEPHPADVPHPRAGCAGVGAALWAGLCVLRLSGEGTGARHQARCCAHADRYARSG